MSDSVKVSPINPDYDVINIPTAKVTTGNEILKKSYDENKLITFTWENINVFTPDKNRGIFNKIGICKSKTEPKHIIKNVNGIAKPGSLLAIMGASGAGKTTLLNILNFRNRGDLKITGDVKINGEIVKSIAAISTMSGYVQQEDIFIETLKVKEQLKFQAMLRMDNSLSNKAKLERVEEVMNLLNLKKCENTIIGSALKNIKGISGGEKRRLAFGCELITNPNLMFCDEPTSGLDSFMAMSIVECMKTLAGQGKTIICTIHQPSSEVFALFDRLCLLAEGRLAYIGDSDQANKFFSSQGFSMPLNYNPADYYIQVLAISPFERETSIKNISTICDGFELSSCNASLNEDMKNAHSMVNDSSLAIKLPTSIDYKVNFLVQFRWLVWRSFLSTLRDPFATKISAVQTIIIAILFGLIYLNLKYDQTGVQNINGVIFLFLTNMSFTNMFAVINSFPSEIPIFLRDHQNGMYRVISYYIAKIITDLPKFIIFPFIFATIIYWMANLNSDAGRFFICIIILILVANTAVSFGAFLSAAAPNANAALALAAPFLVPIMIFSGFFLNNASVPSYFIWLKYLSWFNYSYELLIINQWQGINSLTGCSINSTTTCFYRNGDSIISYLNLNTANYATDFVALVCLLVGWRFLTFIVLLLKANKK